MSFVTLRDFDPGPLSPRLRITARIMSFLDMEPPKYRLIRRLVAQVLFKEAPTVDPLHFTVVYQSPLLDDPRLAKTVHLPLNHDNKETPKGLDLDQSVRSAATFIDHTVRPGSLFFTEGINSLVETAPLSSRLRTLVFSNYGISSFAQRQLTLYGWDALNHNRDLAEPGFIFPRKYESDKMFSIPWLLEVDQIFDRQIFEQYPGLIVDYHKLLYERVYSGFPIRTAAMVSSLIQASSLKPTGIIFCEGGAFHSERVVTYTDETSLSRLYAYLRTVPCIVLIASSHLKCLKPITEPIWDIVSDDFMSKGIALNRPTHSLREILTRLEILDYVSAHQEGIEAQYFEWLCNGKLLDMPASLLSAASSRSRNF